MFVEKLDIGYSSMSFYHLFFLKPYTLTLKSTAQALCQTLFVLRQTGIIVLLMEKQHAVEDSAIQGLGAWDGRCTFQGKFLGSSFSFGCHMFKAHKDISDSVWGEIKRRQRHLYVYMYLGASCKAFAR